MEIENKSFDKLQLELYFFKVFEEFPEMDFEKVKEVMLNIGTYDFEIGYICKIVDEKAIIFRGEDKFNVIENKNYKVGDIAFMEGWEIVFMDIDIYNKIDWKVLLSKVNKLGYLNYGEKIDYENIDYFKVDFVEEYIEKIIKQREDEKIESEKRTINQQKEREEKQSSEEETYNKDSKFKNPNLKVDGKKITFLGYLKRIKFEKNVNKILTYEFVNRLASDSEDKNIIEYLINNDINFKVFKEENGSEILKFSIRFENKKVYMNENRIQRAKIRFIENKLNNFDDESIKQLNKLSGMKVDLLNTKNINLNSVGDIPIKIDFESVDEFKVNLMGKEKIINWEILKKTFFYEGTSRSICRYHYIKAFMEFTESFGIEKQDCYDYLKRIVMLKNLEGVGK